MTFSCFAFSFTAMEREPGLNERHKKKYSQSPRPPHFVVVLFSDHKKMLHMTPTDAHDRLMT